MKHKNTYIILAIIIIALILSISLISKKHDESSIDKIIFEKGNVIEVEVADDIGERSVGLMNKESLDYDEGMLFVFPEEKELGFWMKNTLIPLDVIYLNKNKEIVHIVKNMVPCESDPCKIYSSEVPAMYAIEVNSGYVDVNEIIVGQFVKFG